MSSTSPRLVEVAKENRRGNTESPRDAKDVEEADVPLTAFHTSQVGAVHAGLVGEVFLGYAEPFALCTHPGTEALKVSLAHGADPLAVMPIRLQPMSIIEEGDRTRPHATNWRPPSRTSFTGLLAASRDEAVKSLWDAAVDFRAHVD
jgi:hypothetical protein